MVDPTATTKTTTTKTTTEKDQKEQQNKATGEAVDSNQEEEDNETSLKLSAAASSSTTTATATVKPRDGNVGASNLPGRIDEEEEKGDNYPGEGDIDVNNDNNVNNCTSGETGTAVAALNDQGKPKSSSPSPSASTAAGAAAEKARKSQGEVESEAGMRKGDSSDDQQRERHSIEVLAEEVDGLRRRLDRFHQEQDEYFGHDGGPLVQQRTAAAAAAKTQPRMRELPIPPPPLPNVAPPGAIATAAPPAATISATFPYAQQIPNLNQYPLPMDGGESYVSAMLEERRRYYTQLEYLERRRAHLISQGQSSTSPAPLGAASLPNPTTAGPATTARTEAGISSSSASSDPKTDHIPNLAHLPPPPPPLPSVYCSQAASTPTDRLVSSLGSIPPPTYPSVVPLPQTAGILLRDPLANNLPSLTPGITNLHRHLRPPPPPLRTAQAGFFPTYPPTGRFGINSNYVDLASTPANSGSLSLLSSVSAAAAAAAEAASTATNTAAMSVTKNQTQLRKDPVGKVQSRHSATDGCSPSRSPSLVQRGRVLTATSRGTSTDSEASISLLSLGALSRGSGGSSGTVSEERAQGILPTTKRKLPPQYQPENKTVILGKGNGPKVSPGNIRLKGIILDYVDEYSKGERREKIAIITKIIKEVRQVNTVAGFVKYEDSDGSWWEVAERDARVKVTAVFRDCLHENYRSSSSNKVRRRQEKRQQDKLKRKMKKLTTTANSGDDGNDNTKDDADDDNGDGVMGGS